MNVKFTGITLGFDTDYNNTILDGELILGEPQTWLGFDASFYKGKDIRKTISLQERIRTLDEVINAISKDKYKFDEYTEKNFNTDNIIEYHKKEIKNVP